MKKISSYEENGYKGFEAEISLKEFKEKNFLGYFNNISEFIFNYMYEAGFFLADSHDYYIEEMIIEIEKPTFAETINDTTENYYMIKITDEDKNFISSEVKKNIEKIKDKYLKKFYEIDIRDYI